MYKQINIPLSKDKAGLIFLFVGLGFVALSLFFFFEKRDFLNTALQTEGQIVALNRITSTDSSPTYQAVFTYKDKTGQEFETEEKGSSNPPIGQVGEQVTVLYQENDPGNARIYKPGVYYIIPLIMFLTGAPFAVIGAIIFVKLRGKER